MSLRLQEGAIFITDAHYGSTHRAFYDFLLDIDNGKIATTQLILLGDMFELLFGIVKRTVQEAEKEISLINSIASKMEVLYFEGNHDFFLQDLFPNVKVFTLQQQPQIVLFNEERIELSHGDRFGPLAYRIYTKFIRNGFILTIVAGINALFSDRIIHTLKEKGEQKNQCYQIKNFKHIIEKRMETTRDVDIVIEGHFHQGVHFELERFRYINLDAFACNRKYFIVQSNNGAFSLQEAIYKYKK